MPNNYYNVSTTFIPGTKVRSDQVNTEYQALEAAFDLLPTDTASLILNTATYFGGTAGIGNDYVLSPSPARTSLTDGEEIVFIADRANTGAATMQINALSPVPIVRFDGQPLPAGDIQDGLFHVARYDSFNARFQMVSPALSAISSATDAALSAAAAQAWAINAEDVPVPIIYGGDGVSTFSSFHWAQKGLAAAIINRINTDIVTATPPTTEAVTGGYEIWDADDTDRLMRLGYNAGNGLVLYNYMRGGGITLSHNDAAGAGRFAMTADPDGFTSIWGDTAFSLLAASSTRYQFIESNDIHEFYQTTSPAITAGQPFLMSFRMDDATEIGSLGFSGTELRLVNRTHGGIVSLKAEDSGGTERFLFRGADTQTDIYVNSVATSGVPLWRVTANGYCRNQSVTASQTDINYIEGYDNGGGFAWRVGRENGATSFLLRSLQNSALVRIQGLTSVGATVDMLQGDPDGETQIFYNGVKTIATRADGQLGVYAAGSVSASFDSEVRFKASTGGDWGWVGQVGGQFEVAANLTSAGVTLRGKNSTNTMENLLVGDPDGAVTLYHDGAIKAETFGSGWQIRDDANSGAGGAHSVRFTLASSDGTNRARLGFATQAALSLRNINQGGNVVIDAEDATNVVQSLFIGNPDGTTDLYADGSKRFSAQVAGHITVFGPGNADAENRYLSFEYQNGTRRGYIGHVGSDILRLRNEIHGANVVIDAENLSGTVAPILTADPDGITTLQAASNIELECNGGETALIGTSNADVALYWNNVESFRTQDPNANTKTTAAEVLHADGSFYNIGMNISAPKTENTSFSAAATWQDYAGHSILKTTTATPTYTTPGSTDAVIPNGSVWNIHNIGSSGNITIAAGSGVTLTWQDGAGGTTGNRTIAPGGSATLWKRLDTEFYIYGTGIA